MHTWKFKVPPLKRVCIEGTFFNVMQSLLAIAKSDFLEKCQLSYQHLLVLGTSWVPYIFLLLTWHVDCEHICTRVENPREGVAQIFAWGIKAFQTIFPRGSPILDFITFIFSESFKNLPGGPILHPPSSLTPLCVCQSNICEPSNNLQNHLLRINSKWHYC